jgi:hypothetical protein
MTIWRIARPLKMYAALPSTWGHWGLVRLHVGARGALLRSCQTPRGRGQAPPLHQHHDTAYR